MLCSQAQWLVDSMLAYFFMIHLQIPFESCAFANVPGCDLCTVITHTMVGYGCL